MILTFDALKWPEYLYMNIHIHTFVLSAFRRQYSSNGNANDKDYKHQAVTQIDDLILLLRIDMQFLACELTKS